LSWCASGASWQSILREPVLAVLKDVLTRMPLLRPSACIFWKSAIWAVPLSADVCASRPSSSGPLEADGFVGSAVGSPAPACGHCGERWLVRAGVRISRGLSGPLKLLKLRW
jgi:hypothetical protein